MWVFAISSRLFVVSNKKWNNMGRDIFKLKHFSKYTINVLFDVIFTENKKGKGLYKCISYETHTVIYIKASRKHWGVLSSQKKVMKSHFKEDKESK